MAFSNAGRILVESEGELTRCLQLEPDPVSTVADHAGLTLGVLPAGSYVSAAFGIAGETPEPGEDLTLHVGEHDLGCSLDHVGVGVDPLDTVLLDQKGGSVVHELGILDRCGNEEHAFEGVLDTFGSLCDDGGRDEQSADDEQGEGNR